MIRLPGFIKILKIRLRLVLENKKTAGVLLVVAMLTTILSVKLLKPLWANSQEESPEPVITKLLEGKRAVSIVVSTSNMPLDVLYPGAKVDITDVKNGELVYLARDVAIAGLSIVENGIYAKVILAVDLKDSENLMKNRSDTISMVLSDNKSDPSDIEIVEM